MKGNKLLAGSLVLCALAIGPWHQAMASSYFGEVCLVLEDDTGGLEGTLRIGLDHMGDQHYTGSGNLDVQAPEEEAGLRPANSNAELIEDEWLLSLLSTWLEGNDIFHMRLDAVSFEGPYSRIRTALVQAAVESSYATGTVSLHPDCAVIEPGSSCDDLHIPSGHLPPPGSCRIWNPDIPAGQQSPPDDCDDLEEDLPPGACLVDQYGIVIEIGS